ncbi:MAG: DUF1801 domain-containing protein [Nanoarchaeota archaeon]
MDKKVTAYIGELPSPQKEICKRLRKIVLSLKVKEEMKMGVPWYEGKYYIYGGKDSVNLGVSVWKMSKREMAGLKGKGKHMRHLKFKSLDEIDETKVRKVLKMVKGCYHGEKQK